MRGESNAASNELGNDATAWLEILMLPPPRDYQIRAMEETFDFFQANPSGKLLISSPTGTGKTIVQLHTMFAIKQACPDAIIHLITTRLTIVRDYLKTLGIDADHLSEPAMKETASKHGIYTYLRYGNLLGQGEIDAPDVLLIDECHHCRGKNISIQAIMHFCEKAKIIGYTATPFLYTARATVEFLEWWDKVVKAITIKEACEQGYWKLPTCITRGLIDDDKIIVAGGEFQVRSIEKKVEEGGDSLLAQITDLAIEFKEKTNKGPGVIEVPCVSVGETLHEYMNLRGVRTSRIDHKTPFADRQKALRELAAGESILLQVKIVSEGFNLPQLAFFIDAKPKLSPGDWLQGGIGRLSRPQDREKYYVTITRNLERHAYLLDGLVPSTAIREAQEAFGAPSQRAGCRVFGMPRMGKFVPIPFERYDGVYGSFYLIDDYTPGTNRFRKVAVVLLPDKSEPIIAEKHVVATGKIDKYGNNEWRYSPWREIEMPGDEFCGYTTEKDKYRLSPARQQFWDNCAKRCGLNQERKVNGREFQIMPILRDLKVRL